MNRERRIFRRLPASVVVDDLKERRAIMPGHPMDRRGDEGFFRRGQLHADRGAAVPAEGAAAAREIGQRPRAVDMIADGGIAGDALAEEHCVRIDGLAH